MSGSAAGDGEAEGETINPSSFSGGSTLIPYLNVREETLVLLSTHILDTKSYFFFSISPFHCISLSYNTHLVLLLITHMNLGKHEEVLNTRTGDILLIRLTEIICFLPKCFPVAIAKIIGPSPLTYEHELYGAESSLK